ncbi:MAG TPA: c-type cytochrome [Candidatus Acidoferrales bacterium]
MKISCEILAALSMILGLCACSGLNSRELRDASLVTGGGNASAGRYEIATYGCPTCHTIAGVAGARGLVGPPLNGIGNRSYIAGEIPNTPSNLEHWIQHPHSVEPHTIMPEMNVSDSDSRDIAAYLYTLPNN